MGTTTNRFRRQPRVLPLAPSFPSAQRELAQVNEFETQFIPLVNLPSKGTATLDSNSLDIRMSYEIGSTEQTAVFRLKNVTIEYGVKTHRIFNLNATFGDSSFKMLEKRVGDINRAIDDLAKPFSPDTKKTYQLIKAFVLMAFAEITKSQDEIEKDLFATDSLAAI